jgi:preprotein translocase subunit SecA
MVSRRIEGAQKKVEERNFESRKSLLEYDEVMDEQRKRVYGYRQRILDGTNCKQLILNMIEEQIERHVSEFLDEHYGTDTFAQWVSGELSVEMEPRDFRGLDFNTAVRVAKDEAQRQAESQVVDAIAENLPEEEDERDWNWQALCKFANVKWNLNLRDRDLKRMNRDELSEWLIEQARGAIEQVDLNEGARYLEENYGLRTACGWCDLKFGIKVSPQDVASAGVEEFKSIVRRKAEESYLDKEAQYPVAAGLMHFSRPDGDGGKRYDREGLLAWARDRFDVDLSLDDLKNRQREDVVALLVDQSRLQQKRGYELLSEARQRVDKIFGDAEPETTAAVAGSSGALAFLSDWLKDSLGCDLPPETIGAMARPQLERRVEIAVDDVFRPEVSRMERALVLQTLDAAWKDHLLAMDHLRSSVGLRGYAQVDPKVEYKREGMRTFEAMWGAIGERVTDYFFRMEQYDEASKSIWIESAAIHEEAPAATETAAQQQQAIEHSQGDKKLEPIRNRETKVGRNDPCPCGSGKKFKNCCMRKPAGR